MLDDSEYEPDAPCLPTTKTATILDLRRQIQRLEADAADSRRRLGEMEEEVVNLRHALGLYRDRGGIVERQQQPLADIVQQLIDQQKSPSKRTTQKQEF